MSNDLEVIRDLAQKLGFTIDARGPDREYGERDEVKIQYRITRKNSLNKTILQASKAEVRAFLEKVYERECGRG